MRFFQGVYGNERVIRYLLPSADEVGIAPPGGGEVVVTWDPDIMAIRIEGPYLDIKPEGTHSVIVRLNADRPRPLERAVIWRKPF